MFQTNYWTELGLALTSGIGETFFTTWCRGSALENILGDCARAKVSGIRSEVFGELTFIGHGDVSINPQSKLHFLLLYDGATSLTTAYVIQNRSDTVTISHLQEYFDTYQLNPRYIVADQAFMGTEMEDFYGRHNNIPVVPHKAVAEVPKIGDL